MASHTVGKHSKIDLHLQLSILVSDLPFVLATGNLVLLDPLSTFSGSDAKIRFYVLVHCSCYSAPAVAASVAAQMAAAFALCVCDPLLMLYYSSKRRA